MADDVFSSPPDSGSVTPEEEPKPPTSLIRMLNAIKEERQRTKFGQECADGGFELVSVNNFWAKLFADYFISGGATTDDARDDMLFFVRKTQVTKGKVTSMQTDIDVFRRDSKRIPALTDAGIDWEETVYLNIILHQFEYTVTCAVTTRTSENTLEILKKFTQRVYPSPSRRSMDSKGTSETITYPNIFFTVDNFEEAFQDIVVRDGECIAVELTASDRDGGYQCVNFVGSVKYEPIKRTYDSKASLTHKMAQRMNFGWFQGRKRVEFLRMRGPRGKGHAEMAVSRVKGSGPETPDAENFPVGDFEDQDPQQQYAQRRMSDPSSTVGTLVRGGFRRAMSMKKSRSETDSVDSSGGDGCSEVEAGTLQDELDSSVEQYNGFWGKSFGQAWHWFKEKRRAGSVALNCYLTYITLPWHHIVQDIFDPDDKPALTH